MRTRSFVVAALVGLVMAFASSPAHAGHHLWRLTQLFSNASGSTQFVELFTAADNEPNLGAFTVTTDTNTFAFMTNLPSTMTANTWVLLATSNFAGFAGGVPPDYIIPANFFPTGGGTINYAGIDPWIYGTVPTDGRHSLMRDGTTAVNSPINFAGQRGVVNLAGAPVPAVRTAGIIVLSGGLLLVASGLLGRRRRRTPGSFAA